MSDSNGSVANRERWLPVVGHEGSYEVSDLGRVRSLDRTRVYTSKWGTPMRRFFPGRILFASSTAKTGYSIVHFGNGQSGLVHRLVLTAFVGPPPEGTECCHNDGNPQNNRLENLRWDTHQSNLLDQAVHGNHHCANRMRCPRKHLLVAPNLRPTTRGKTCLACFRTFGRRQTARKYGRSFDFQAVSDQIFEEIMRAG